MYDQAETFSLKGITLQLLPIVSDHCGMRRERRVSLFIQWIYLKGLDLHLISQRNVKISTQSFIFQSVAVTGNLISRLLKLAII